MPLRYYQPISHDEDSSRFAASESTIGPWSPQLQHGGPPNALAVATAERVVADVTGRTDLVAVRLSADFVGPVPVGEMVVSSRLIRAARSAALVDVDISAGGRLCLRSRIWFVRESDTTDLTAAPADPLPPPESYPLSDSDFPYGRSLEWRRVRGGLGQVGPGAAWVRPLTALMDGYELSGLARAVLIGDSASGLSAELDWNVWSFTNVDLDVHLARPFVGEWLHMDAVTQLGTHGSALARSTLSDKQGVVGAGLQTLVVAPIRR